MTDYSNGGVVGVRNLINTDILKTNFFKDNFSDFYNNLECKYLDEKEFTDHFKNSPTNFLALSMNIRSLPNKFVDLNNLLDRYKVKNVISDLLCIQETWQSDLLSLNINNYSLFSAVRSPGARGGGVCIYLNDLYHGSVLNESIFIENTFESLAVKIVIPGVGQQIAVCLYRPPSASNDLFFNTLAKLLDSLRVYGIPIYIYTDINLDLMQVSADPLVSRMVNIFTSFSYVNYITKCTRFDDSSGSRKCIDHIWSTEDPINIESTGICIDALADHFIAAVCSKLEKSKKPPKKETFSRSFSDINVEKFREALAGISFSSIGAKVADSLPTLNRGTSFRDYL